MNSPVGIFDSGLGGLSVAAQVMRLLPNEQIIYLADSAHVPYGERPLEEIREFALDIVQFLLVKGAKAVVMACNMSSAIALEAARKAYDDLPIIGMIEPGSKAAISKCCDKPIGVLATTGTVKSEAYVRTISKFSKSTKIIQQACPKFVPLVESGKWDSEEAEAAAQTYVAPLLKAGCESIILGCTHYPFLRNAIESAVGQKVAIVDPAEETAHLLGKTLIECRLASNTLGAPHEFYTTGNTDGFATLGSAFLGRPIEKVHQAVWGVDLGIKKQRPTAVRLGE